MNRKDWNEGKRVSYYPQQFLTSIQTKKEIRLIYKDANHPLWYIVRAPYRTNNIPTDCVMEKELDTLYERNHGRGN